MPLRRGSKSDLGIPRHDLRSTKFLLHLRPRKKRRTKRNEQSMHDLGTIGYTDQYLPLRPLTDVTEHAKFEEIKGRTMM
jgi:hypothetical protein